MTKDKAPNQNEQQIRYYRGMIERIRRGTEAAEKPTAKFECPAIVTNGGRSAMQKFMLLMANSMLTRIGLIT